MAEPQEEPQEPVEPIEEEAPVEPEAEEPQEPSEEKDPDKQLHVQARKDKDTPKPGSERYEKIYAEAQEYRRTAEALGYKYDKGTKLHEIVKTKLSKVDEDLAALRKHNEELARAIAEKEERKKDDAVDTVRTTERQQLSSLRAAKKQAIDGGDYEKAFAIQDQIDDVVLNMAQPKPEEIVKISTKATEQQVMQSAVAEFERNATWFSQKLPDGRQNPNYDPAKRGMAIALEQDLLPTWNGSYQSLLQEVKSKVEERFTEKTPQKSPVPGVAGAVKAVPASAGNPSLTAEEKRVVKMMFPDDPDGEKKYAAQLKAMGRK